MKYTPKRSDAVFHEEIGHKKVVFVSVPSPHMGLMNHGTREAQ